MIHFKQNFWKIFLALVMFAVFFVPKFSLAQEQAKNALSFTITPPLFQISVSPDDVWQSSLKIVNGNNYDITVYASTLDFDAGGEEGHARFIPILADKKSNPRSLANWITVSPQGFLIPREQSVKIPFTITVPHDAEPGGHYAAILIGTKPVGARSEGTSISVSSFISSLLLVRVPGDIRESGDIREFTTTKEAYSTPEASFVMRFENKGNVHIQPQGDIKILNMWGKERGVIPINEATDFGNVLPGSTRKYEFSWKGEGSVWEAGRYTAIATLTFGSDAKQNVTRATYFWFVPIVPILLIIGGFVFVMLVIILGVRTYVRRALAIEMLRQGVATSNAAPRQSQEAPQGASQLRTGILRAVHLLSNPIREGFADISSIFLSKKSGTRDASQPGTFFHFFKKYYRAIAFVPLAIIAFGLMSLYLAAVFSEGKSYEIEVSKSDGQSFKISSERIIKMDLERTAKPDAYMPYEKIPSELSRTPVIDIINMGGEPGQAARAAITLEKEGFTIHDLSSAKEKLSTTTISYREGMRAHAESFARALSVQPEFIQNDALQVDLKIHLGSDFHELP